jgi:MoaA/NifB/PqqE/SkfB family radical SAM enzyme
MADHVLFCSDLAWRDPSGKEVTRVQGWCLGNMRIRGIALQMGASDYQPLAYGMAREDVGRAYPDYERASIAGFRSLTPFAIPPAQPVALSLEIDPGKSQAAEYHVVSVNLDTRDVQTIELNEETRLRGAAIDHSMRTRSESAVLEGRVRESLRTRRGLTLRLDLINKCNLRCIMCHFSDDAIFRRPTKQLTTEEFKTLFDEIGPYVSDAILSCGDEPLLSKFLGEILSYLAEKHPNVAIEFCTNAMLMRAPIRKVMIETRVARVLFSIDAVSKKLLESIRVGCRYEQVLGNIMALRDLKAQMQVPYPSFLFNFVLMERNVQEAPAFLKMAKALGATSVDFRHMVPIAPYFDPADQLDRQPARYNYYREQIIREAQEMEIPYFLPAAFATDERWLPPEKLDVDLAEFHRVVADLPGADLPVITKAPVPANGSRDETVAVEDFSATFCTRPFSEITLRDQDEVLPCPWHDKTLGYLRDGKNLSEIFFGEDFARLRRNMLKADGDPNCARCPIKSGHLPTTANN